MLQCGQRIRRSRLVRINLITDRPAIRQVTVDKLISINKFITAIRRLPSDKPVDDPKKWYRTQREHWIGWLSEYHGPGAYERKAETKRDARFAYNHVIEPKMLVWLINAGGVSPHLVAAARREAAEAISMQQQSAIIRHHVPWEVVTQALWPKCGTGYPDES